jgi:hypothetical protein
VEADAEAVPWLGKSKVWRGELDGGVLVGWRRVP